MKKRFVMNILICLSFVLTVLTACGQEDKQGQEDQQRQQGVSKQSTRVIPMQPNGPPVRGNLAPDFTLQDLEGRTWSLAELKGKVVFINFWATWCAPCISELPSMKNLYNTLPKDQFTMLAILHNDEPNNAKGFVEKLDIPLPILLDTDNRVGMQYGLTGVPETFILDKKGIIREMHRGPAEWDSAEVIQLIKEYIEQE